MIVFIDNLKKKIKYKKIVILNIVTSYLAILLFIL